MQQSPIREKRVKGKGHNADKNTAKAKFIESRAEEAKAKAIVPMNEKQREYLKALSSVQCKILLVTGYARNFKNLYSYSLGL